MAEITGLDLTLQEMAARIRELRQVEGLSPAQMAEKTGVTAAEYLACESGTHDLNFAFLYRCALAFGVDVTDLIEGSSPTLSTFDLTRAGEGQRIEKAHGMTYYNMASAFKDRIANPLYTVAEYSEAAQRQDIPLTTHEGQEFDLVISGHLKVQVGTHQEVLGPGDTIYYDSSTPHGMIAVDGEDCEFYAMVLNPTEYIAHKAGQDMSTTGTRRSDDQHRVYEDYITPVEDEHGALVSLSYHDDEHFNFAFDVVDKISRKDPKKLAFLHISNDGTERRFTFTDVRYESSRTANYFKSLGIRRGDKVMLILKRHYQFWFIINALHKLGAVVILAPNQLLEKDIAYRYQAAGVRAIMCTSDGQVADEADRAAQQYDAPLIKVVVNGEREGWHHFDTEYKVFSSHYDRPEDAPGGDDDMLMFFTSGTSGYPKIAVHSYKYPLGHFVTAHYWHQVDPNGLHLSISDTGWAKSMWGKLYGQWLCEAPLFIYDFDRFHAENILPMFAKYNITTFCAPPTMLRMMIKEDIMKYDLSSVKHMTTAGEALNPEVFRRFQEATGLSIMEGFGQSEGTVLVANTVGMTPKLGSMGKPVANYDIDIFDPDGKPVPVGVAGEICIRMDKGHPNGLVKEYYRDPEKTAETFRNNRQKRRTMHPGDDRAPQTNTNDNHKGKGIKINNIQFFCF